MTNDQFQKLMRAASKECQALNAGLLLDRVSNPVGKSDSRKALDRCEPTQKSGLESVQGCGPKYRVSIISARRRSMDLDNLIAGAKAIRDAIAFFLGCDDNEQFIQWDYHQLISDRDGTLVTIEKL